jgi:hypothetical protein
MRLLAALLVMGLVFGGAGLYLLAFTNITDTQGLDGILLVVVLITLGVFLAVPAKVYIILRFTGTCDRTGPRMRHS